MTIVNSITGINYLILKIIFFHSDSLRELLKQHQIRINNLDFVPALDLAARQLLGLGKCDDWDLRRF